METIAISKFKATCLQLIERIKKTGHPYLITKRGKPMALITVPPPVSNKKSPFGCMKDSIRINGDILSPLSEDWEVLR